MSRIVNPKHVELLKRAKPPLNFKNMVRSGISDQERVSFDQSIRENRQESRQEDNRERRIVELFSKVQD
jgi:hypothetical protein